MLLFSLPTQGIYFVCFFFRDKEGFISTVFNFYCSGEERFEAFANSKHGGDSETMLSCYLWDRNFMFWRGRLIFHMFITDLWWENGDWSIADIFRVYAAWSWINLILANQSSWTDFGELFIYSHRYSYGSFFVAWVEISCVNKLIDMNKIRVFWLVIVFVADDWTHLEGS